MTDKTTPRGYHDIGGLPGGFVEQTEHVLAPWEKRVDVLTMVLSAPENRERVLYLDERRYKIESIGEETYTSLNYYELWMQSTVSLLYDKGVLTEDEVNVKMFEIRKRLGLPEDK